MNNTTRVRRIGSGRTAGSHSFVRVPLRRLIISLGDNTPILMSRIQARQLGIRHKSAPATALHRGN